MSTLFVREELVHDQRAWDLSEKIVHAADA